MSGIDQLVRQARKDLSANLELTQTGTKDAPTVRGRVKDAPTVRRPVC